MAQKKSKQAVTPGLPYAQSIRQVKAKVSCSLPRILPKERELEEVDKFQKKSSRRLFEAIPTAVFIAEEALGKPKDQQTSGAPSFLQSS